MKPMSETSTTPKVSVRRLRRIHAQTRAAAGTAAGGKHHAETFAGKRPATAIEHGQVFKQCRDRETMSQSESS